MLPNTTYLMALKQPIIYYSVQTEKYRIINPDIPFDEFKIEFDDVGTRSLKVYINTPRMYMYSIGSQDDDTNKNDLTFMHNLYGSPEIMQKYGSGMSWDQRNITTRFKHFSDTWQKKKSPFSGFVCYNNNNDDQVGIFNIGDSDTAGIAEFAAISTPQYWNQGYASEIGLLLYKYPKMIRDAGYRLNDGSNLRAITATARTDNGSAFVMERLGLNYIKDEKKFGIRRKVFYSTIDDLQKVVVNSRIAKVQSTARKNLSYI